MEIKNINKVVNSFNTFDTMFELLKVGDYSFLIRECGTMNYPEIKWMTEYFIKSEEYEKCNFLSKLRLPEPSKEKLDKEIRWLDTKNKNV